MRDRIRWKKRREDNKRKRMEEGRKRNQEERGRQNRKLLFNLVAVDRQRREWKFSVSKTGTNIYSILYILYM